MVNNRIPEYVFSAKTQTLSPRSSYFCPDQPNRPWYVIHMLGGVGGAVSDGSPYPDGLELVTDSHSTMIFSFVFSTPSIRSILRNPNAQKSGILILDLSA